MWTDLIFAQLNPAPSYSRIARSYPWRNLDRIHAGQIEVTGYRNCFIEIHTHFGDFNNLELRQFAE